MQHSGVRSVMKPSKSAVRLDPYLVYEAEMEARIQKRSTPKQIEYLAEIGKKLSASLDPNEIIAITQGVSLIEIKPANSYAVNPDEVFARVEEERASGYLSARVTSARVSYEASSSQPGLLNRINADGSIDTGHFKNGEFVIL